MGGTLEGLVVVERAGRLSTAATGNLLASLGARVLRVERAEHADQLSACSLAERMLRAGGKERVALPVDPAEFWRRCLAVADVFLVDPPLAADPDQAVVHEILAADPGDKVICVFSPAGLAGGDAWIDAPDALLQALGGSMAVTGYEGGPPEFARIPVAELNAAVIAASAILSALHVRRRDLVGQLIDLSLIEVTADQLRTHVPSLATAGPHDFRQGCRHPICCPWNVFRARDGWILICSSSDAHWHAVLDVIGRPEVKQESRFAHNHHRRPLANEVDAMIEPWVSARSMNEAVAALIAGGVPSGEALTVPGVLAEGTLRRRGTAQDVAPGIPVLAGVLGLGRSGAKRLMTVKNSSRGLPADLLPRAAVRAKIGAVRAPLADVRVVEISRFAAGPLAGTVLAALGADVIKIESPGGEECRRWVPQFDGVSSYFANYNAGKKSVVLDLRREADCQQLRALVAGSDVFLQNLRPGVMEKMGFDAVTATAAYPRLVHASISGFGLDGPELPALDTVIQGLGGLTSLIGDGATPCRFGFSIADQLSGQITALTILAALAERERSGRGQIVDTAMVDAMAWLTQLAWPDGRSGIPPCSRWQARDGWVAAAAAEATVRATLTGIDTTRRTRDEIVRALRDVHIMAAPVLEPEEVFALPTLRARQPLYDISSGSATVRVLSVPLGLTRTPALRPARMRVLGEDNAKTLRMTTS
jgi:crotonobetainyl-CoA:carnitine CoA-transferase CaiB-like acyl-CoA transferase